jgi:DnaJ like chaperone protein
MFGRLIGIVFGFVVFNFPGALIGYFIGRYFDRSVNGLGRGGMSAEEQAAAQQVFFETVFSLMGILAKADGRVSEAEIAQATAVMDQQGLSQEHRHQAIALFKSGAAGEFTIDEIMAKFNQTCARYANLKRMLLAYLIGAAMADGTIDQQEQQILAEVSKAMGISDFAFKQLLAMIQAQSNFKAGGQQGYQNGGAYHRPATTQQELAVAYQALGVSEGDDDKTLKRAYRKLMSENHPDKLRGQGVPDDMLRMATERSQEITTAYELIKKQRSGK